MGEKLLGSLKDHGEDLKLVPQWGPRLDKKSLVDLLELQMV